jgi:CRP/FNR family transcriptional regulator
MEEQCLKNCPYRNKDTYCTDSIRLFQHLPEDARQELRALAIHTSRKKKEIIARNGDLIDSVLIIRSGEVKTSVSDEAGREHVFDFLHGGQAIWHGIFLQNHRYTYDVTAVSDVSLCIIRRDDFMRVLRKNPDTAMYLIEMLSTELQDANEKNIVLSIKDPTARLASFLDFHDARARGEEIHMKLEDIANAISLRPETVSRSIASLTRKKLIVRTGRGRIRVIDPVGLAEISHDSEE